jgi:hypothetical protein
MDMGYQVLAIYVRAQQPLLSGDFPRPMYPRTFCLGSTRHSIHYAYTLTLVHSSTIVPVPILSSHLLFEGTLPLCLPSIHYVHLSSFIPPLSLSHLLPPLLFHSIPSHPIPSPTTPLSPHSNSGSLPISARSFPFPPYTDGNIAPRFLTLLLLNSSASAPPFDMG